MERNELWKLEPGWIAGYTEDRELIRRIKRYKTDWQIIAEYYRFNKLVAVQYKIPAEQRKSAERMFEKRVKIAI
ncbi:hypothetical protein OE105_04610 [Fervidibacillus halotolerans]|uniref:Uncharacterized protein n=1 Tax=Fervidibacillus halotolerans TaxID=2980027 RepID=A0A9E8M1W7_9BACI|nr:hypothetical protein [Fervidibacillus halotolerans]WAA13887.1 hypothetical protein OE105_04610 [Fervidibacillus halotolerans]